MWLQTPPLLSKQTWEAGLWLSLSSWDHSLQEKQAKGPDKIISERILWSHSLTRLHQKISWKNKTKQKSTAAKQCKPQQNESPSETAACEARMCLGTQIRPQHGRRKRSPPESSYSGRAWDSVRHSLWLIRILESGKAREPGVRSTLGPHCHCSVQVREA